MKSFFLAVFFFLSSLFVFSQTASKSKWDRWALIEKEYLWSYIHRDSTLPGKPVIDFEAIENWESLAPSLGCLSLSRDGQYMTYGISTNSQRQLDTLVVQSTMGSWRQAIPGAKPGFFAGNGKQYIYQDGEGLCFLQTGSSESRHVKEVAGYTLPRNGHNDWFAYQLKDAASTVVLHNLVNGQEKRYTGVSGYSFDPTIRWLACQLNNDTKELLIDELASGKEQRFPSVAGYSLDMTGTWLLLKTIEGTKAGTTATTLYYINLSDRSKRTIWSSTDSSQQLNSYSFDKTGKQVVFTISASMGNSIGYWQQGMENGVLKLTDQTAGIDASSQVGTNASFSENGRYIQFELYPRPETRLPDPDASQVDVWSYQDRVLQSTQQRQLTQPKTFKAIMNIISGQVIQLEDVQTKLLNWIPGDHAVVAKQCCGDRFWEKGYGRDSTWLVSLQTGFRQLLPVHGNGISFSPDGRWLVYFEGEKGCNYFSHNLSTGEVRNLTTGTPAFQFGWHSLYQPTKEKPTRFAGPSPVEAWVGNDGVLVLDDYDIWQLDLTGRNKPINLTNGYGRTHHIQFELSGGGKPYRLADNATLLLKAFNHDTKYNGFFWKISGHASDPEQLGLYMQPCFMERLTPIFGSSGGMAPLKAADANVWLVQRETATESPNYFVTHDFRTYRQLTFLAPEKKYNWYTTELHRFKQLDGTYSQGVLYKPENFDPYKRYPVIISFYIALSDQLYQYIPPGYINKPTLHDHPAWMVSHGYLVFAPDIYFTQGQWGPSTVNTMDGAARYLKTLSYVDGKHLGAVGHSNSGRFGKYLLTHSQSFAAMSIGSGATDMLSSGFYIEPEAGNGKSFLEWAEVGSVGTGLGILWKNKESWLDHTSVLNADKVTCPLLLFHCKEDAVPVSQAIEMFTALWRLEKKCWWLQYDQGNHTLSDQKDMRDFTIRYTQFFDHYLKGAPAPYWMTKGIPASLKTIESRYALDLSGSCGKECIECKNFTKQKIH